MSTLNYKKSELRDVNFKLQEVRIVRCKQRITRKIRFARCKLGITRKLLRDVNKVIGTKSELFEKLRITLKKTIARIAHNHEKSQLQDL